MIAMIVDLAEGCCLSGKLKTCDDYLPQTELRQNVRVKIIMRHIQIAEFF